MAPDVLLPCGAAQDAVAGAALDDEAGAAGHPPGCPHCDATRPGPPPLGADPGLARRPVAPPPSVARAVFARVGSARAGGQVALPSAGPGRTVLAAVAIADIARRAARATSGVAAVRHVEVVRWDGRDLHLAAEVVPDLAWTHPLPPLATGLRHAVTTAVEPVTGLAVARVDVTFTD